MWEELLLEEWFNCPYQEPPCWDLGPQEGIIKVKGPQPAQNDGTAKQVTPDKTKKTVWKISNLKTQEVDNLLEDEEEFNSHINEAEHDIGMNQSAVDWLGVNFENPRSSFGNSGEFSRRRISISRLNKCTDCEINSKTVDKQRELLMKLDRQIQDSYKIQKQDRLEKEGLNKKFKESMQLVDSTTTENVNLKVDSRFKKTWWRQCNFRWRSIWKSKQKREMKPDINKRGQITRLTRKKDHSRKDKASAINVATKLLTECWCKNIKTKSIRGIRWRNVRCVDTLQMIRTVL